MTSMNDSSNMVGPSTLQPYRQQYHDLQTLLSSFRGEDAALGEGKSSWSDVLQSMSIAKEDYSQKRGRVKAEGLHANKTTVATLEMLTDMIPDQDGLSVLRGGLRTVFKLVHRRIQNREEILDAFEDIPLIFLRACEMLQTHPDDGEILQYVQELFIALVKHIPSLINILLRRHKGSLPSRIFKQHPEHEASTISACLAAVSRASRRVSDRISVLEDRAIFATLEHTQHIHLKVNDASREAQFLHEALHAHIDRKFDEQAAQIRDEIMPMINMAKPFYTALQSWGPFLVASLGDPQRLLAEVPLQQQYYSPQVPWPSRDTLPCPASSPAASTDVLRALALPDPVLVEDDICQALHAGNTMRADHGHKPLEQAGYVILEPRFRTWIQPSNGIADAILVHGRLGDYTEGRISGLSVVAALFTAVSHFPQFVVLQHFCALHDRRGDVSRGPVGLLQSLVSQLLAHVNRASGLAFLHGMGDNPGLLEGVANGDLAALCWFFTFLFYRLQPGLVVYCIIDGIDSFEGGSGDWEAQICDVVDLLNGLVVAGGSRGPILKLLLTAARSSIKVYRRLDASCQIWLSEDKRLPITGDRSILESDLGRAIAL